MDIVLKFINEAVNSEAKSGWVPTDRYYRYNLIKTPQAKGKIGTQILAHHLQIAHPGCEYEIIEGDKASGDLRYRYRKSSQHKWTTVEVKLSKCRTSVLKSGLRTLKFWWNQIRQTEPWDEVVLVGIFPNHCRIWRKTRAEWIRDHQKLSSCAPGHTGTDDLWQVTLIKNSKCDNFHEWDQIYSNQQGNLI